MVEPTNLKPRLVRSLFCLHSPAVKQKCEESLNGNYDA
jgi:hypothetical protein